ncbi:MAG: DNA-binding response OmpR family regulator, partial [Chlamydiales bacterium]
MGKYMSEEQETSTGTGINKLKILLVDDDSEFCKQLTTRSLTFKSLEITSVDSIEGAKEKINTDDYEAYFVGENLSDGKGIEFIKYLREEEKTKGKYLAYLTLSCKDVSSFQIIKSGLGVDLILHKPVNSRNIHYLLDQVEKSGNE